MSQSLRRDLAIPLLDLDPDGAAAEIELEYTIDENGKLVGTGETLRIAADQVFKAIGQVLTGAPEGLDLDGGKIAVTGAGRTSRAGVWAGGDIVTGAATVILAMGAGREAANSMHDYLTLGW